MSCFWFWFFIAAIPHVLSSPFSKNEIQEILDFHNSLRRTAYPPASNMLMLAWNSVYEKLAQRASDACIFDHNYGPDYYGLGENIYQGSSSSARNALFAWWLEGENYDFSKKVCDPKNGKYPNYNTCGHYYQAVGANVFEMGCARQMCSSNYLIFCEYNGFPGSPLYKVGPPCSACPSSMPLCYQGLCISRGDIEKFGKENISCELICKNCGTRFNAPNTCRCICPSGFIGSDCSEKRSASAKANCSACVAAGTPCLNGGLEISVSGQCRCQCVGEFSGLQCQINLSQLKDGLLIKFGGEMKLKSYYPIEHRQWPKLLTAINEKIVNEVNKLCTTDAYFFQCCPMSNDNDAKKGNKMLLSDVTYLKTANTYPIVRASGELEAVVYIYVTKDNNLCSSTSSWILDGGVLLAAFENVKASLSEPLKSCCGDAWMKIISSARSVALKDDQEFI